jgi:hypothetical protein
LDLENESSSNAEASPSNFVETAEQDKSTCQTFPDDLSKSEKQDPTQPKLSVYPWRFYGNDKILKRRFQTSFYSEFP